MMWRAWQIDTFTAAWIVWIAAFIIVETWAVRTGYWGTLTSHLRPLFLSAPVTWWVAFGLWLWFGIHMLAPNLEAWLLDAVGRGTP